METSDVPLSNLTYVLVIDCSGEVDILQVSYLTTWEDLRCMLEVKFDYESTPIFTYTDDEEELICLDNQEALNEALKICRKNDDVLHVQIRKEGEPLPLIQKSSRQTDQRLRSLTKDHIEMARVAMGNTLGWAASAVKSAFSRGVSMNSDSSSISGQRPQLNPPDITMQAEDVRALYPVLHNIDDSAHTSVKEPVDSESCDISVPTSLPTGFESDSESEVIVKKPFESTSQQTETPQVDQDLLKAMVQEEVRMYLSKQLPVIEEKIATGMSQSVFLKPSVEAEVPCTSKDDLEISRSPTEIKADIRKLKLEMKGVKLQRKLKKHQERALKKQTLAQSTELISPLASQTEQTKPVRKYAASFICENLLDGSCVGVDQVFVKYWVLKNEGSVAWDHHIELKLIDENLTDNSSPVDPKSDGESGFDGAYQLKMEAACGPEKTSYPMPIVENGGTAVIAVSHRAPSFPCIYTSAWRLCRRNKFFGPRIWCRVAVKTNYVVPYQSAEDSLVSLSEQELSIASKNWETSRKVSANEEPLEHGDNLSNMLSFEMTAVGDFNKETSNADSNNYNFAVSYPPRQQSSLEGEEPVSEVRNEEVQVADDGPASVLEHDLEVEDLTREVVDLAIESHKSDHETEEELEQEEVPQKEETPEVEGASEEQDTPEEDEEEQEFNDTNSDVPSDYEVIPLPECFDTSKPLSTKEVEVLSSLNAGRPSAHVEKDEDEPPSVLKDDGVEVAENNNHQEEENIQVSTVSSSTTPQATSSSQTASVDVDKSVAPSCLPVPQSVLELDKPAPQCAPTPVPASVLALDDPCEVQDYDAGYVAPAQRTAPPEEPWVPTPIPLPRAVLDTDKPWIPSNVAAAIVPPSPHPRTSASSQENFAPLPEPPVAPNQEAVQPTTSGQSSRQLGVLSASPQHEEEENEEFSLAPDRFNTAPALFSDGLNFPTSRAATVPAPLVAPRAAPILSEPQNQSPLEQLVDMGFYDIELNEDLLRRYRDDVNKVVNALVHGSPRNRDHGSNRRPDGAYYA